jgi:hypothetical protein
MQAFVRAELKRRGVSEAESKAVPPFGGPIYANSIAKPKACGAGEGVDPEGLVHWNGGPARYVYVLEAESKNPGVPPSLDTPEGTLWRLDVLASERALPSGVEYGTTPEGSFQHVPAAHAAPALHEGTTYHLNVLLDVGLPTANCLFTFGDDVPSARASSQDAGASSDADSLQCLGAMCTTSGKSDACNCAADYCALMPGQTEGYCTRTGCKEDPSVCPADWSCLDLSQFLAGQPAICIKP